MTSFIINEEGFLLGCGNNQYGQLGLGDKKCRNTFFQLSDMKFSTVSYGNNHVMAIDTYGFLWACGRNDNGQLGLKLQREQQGKDIDTFEKVSDQKFKSVSCGYGHTVAIDENGFLWACGSNTFGQLCLDPCPMKDKNMRVLEKISDKKFKDVSCGLFHTVVLDEDGFLWSYSCNCYGRPCYHRCEDVNVFTKISDHKFKKIHCGGSYMMAFDEDGFLWARGENEYGQLGVGSNDKKINILTRVSYHKFMALSCGEYHTMALDEKGCLWACGAALGLDDERNTFEKVSNQKFKSVGCGSEHTFLIDENGKLWASGHNDYGQLGFAHCGDGDCDVDTFVKIENMNNIKTLMNNNLSIH